MGGGSAKKCLDIDKTFIYSVVGLFTFKCDVTSGNANSSPLCDDNYTQQVMSYKQVNKSTKIKFSGLNS